MAFSTECAVVLCPSSLSLSTYLGIFETKMTHVVVDQAEGKAPIHDGQALLWRESKVSTQAADVCKICDTLLKKLLRLFKY